MLIRQERSWHTHKNLYKRVVADLIRMFIRNFVLISILIEGSLEVKLPIIWTDEKHSQEEAEPGRNSEVEKVRRETIRDGDSQKRKDAGAQKGRKVAKHCVFFQCFVAPEG